MHEDAIRRVDTFLQLMARRQLAEAATYLAPEVRMTFPPGITFRSLDELVANARGRYRWVDKVRERYEAFSREDGAIVVYSMGTLFGENVFGVPFSGVRYLDRFVLRDGLIVEQDVWNDLAESGVLTRQAAPAEAAL
ncbi:MAG: membrane protein [Dehalococcoidia bacterium]|nr:MAG: membrane protein [Dehalococcoidia bacterium]